MKDWDTYYKAHKSRGPREQVVRALGACKERESALDLGAGTLVESAFLLENDFKNVTAVDSSPQTKSFAESFDQQRFTLKICSYQEFNFPKNYYDLINAQYALPFYGKDGFEKFIEKIKLSLKPGGIFVGQFFGVNDEWNAADSKLAFQTKDEVLNMLSELEMIEFNEEEKDGKTASGETKHWHVFHFITKK
ncbi:MAG: class I SAM-dependent methyltransferase [Candidatus Levybacteria bacterium]|nr:class I SAM-dependent methyltransferase [Candidatus Levybacteria bacterium]